MSCGAAREWLSAQRDGEALDDGRARAHVDACAACAAWTAALDDLTPRLRLRPVGSPDVVAAALAAWQGQAADAPRRRQTALARALLAVAGVTGLVLGAVTLAGTAGGAAGTHAGWERAAFDIALALGFVLCARRPERYAHALLPLVTAVTLLTLLPASAHLTGARSDVVAEAAHLPVLAGLAGLLLWREASGWLRVRRRAAS